MKDKLAELQQRLRKGDISRRDFVHAAALLTVGIGITACSPGSDSTNGLTRLINPNWRTSGNAQTGPDVIEPNNYNYQSYNQEPPDDKQVWKTANPDGSPLENSTPAPRDLTPFSWYCPVCGQRFVSQDSLVSHFISDHAKRVPEKLKLREPHYYANIFDKVPQFDEKNTIFNRVLWDPSYQKMVGEASARMRQNPWINQETRAWTAAAIYVDNKVGNLNEGYSGYDGRVKGAGGLYDWDEPINAQRFEVEDTQWMTDRVKEVAHFCGADLVGITKVDPRWVYSYTYENSTMKHEPNTARFKYAIVLGIEMDWKYINDSPGALAEAAASRAYSNMAEVTAKLAAYIRALGYPAVPSGNDTAQNIPMAIDAGLGEHGRNGLLITPEFGARQRICKVLTDLPLVADQPIEFGMQDFCMNCHSCANSCPARAIMFEDELTEKPTSISNRTGIRRWVVNVEKCFQFWVENEGVSCGNCIASCPWSLQNNREWLET